MRKIKFKAWNKKTNKMDIGVHIFINGVGIVWENKRKGFDDFDCLSSTSDYILMQFIGIKDKDEKEIFEGDIIRFWLSRDDEDNPHPFSSPFRSFIGEIGFNDNFEIEIRNEVYEGKKSCKKDLPKYEILGNIHENPDLLD